MSVPILLYALFTSLGVLGLGNAVWTLIRRYSESAVDLDNESSAEFKEHPLLKISISWFLGYFIFEGVLYLLAACRLFGPLTVIMCGAFLTIVGLYWIFTKHKTLSRSWQDTIEEPFELIILLLMGGFIYLWNLYPLFDVDSLTDYFTYIKKLLINGGVYFSQFDDVRNYTASGENLISSIGFALNFNSTLFPQLIHGISKVMAVFCVYGAARSLGLGVFSLIPSALVLSEEHFIASGVNISVHINVLYMMALFFVFFGLFVYLAKSRIAYFYLALLAALFAVLCKYVGLIYFALLLGVSLILCILHKGIRVDVRSSMKGNPKLLWILAGFTAAAMIPYLSNWVLTGSPVYPSSLGPFKAQYYDAAVQELGKIWHYNIGPGFALKTITSFMVWPGILSLKILFPLALSAGAVQLLVLKKPHNFFIYGMIFFTMSLVIVLIQQTTFVYEMRYYRFGMMIYSLACAFLIASIFELIFSHWEWLKLLRTLGIWSAVIILCLFSVKHSFKVMGSSRASYNDILKFISGKITEPEIFEERYGWAKQSYDEYQSLRFNDDELGMLLPMSWPQSVYMAKGKDLSFLKTAAMPSYAYFNEGAFAVQLDSQGIKYLFNQLALTENYPLPGGAAYSVISQCGVPLIDGNNEFLRLNRMCLKRIGSTIDVEDGKNRLRMAVEKVKSRPQYDPFVKPEYGGISGLIK